MNHPLLNSPWATRETIRLTNKRVLERLVLTRRASLSNRDMLILNDQLLLLNYRKFLFGQEFSSAYYTKVRRAAITRRNISLARKVS